jgi:hypothetical protein
MLLQKCVNIGQGDGGWAADSGYVSPLSPALSPARRVTYESFGSIEKAYAAENSPPPGRQRVGSYGSYGSYGSPYTSYGRERGDSVAYSIISDTRANEADAARRIPWGHFFRHPTARTMLLAWWVMAWIGFLMLSEMPSFLIQEFNYNIGDAGFVSVLPFLAQLVSSIGFGHVFTYLEGSRWRWTTRHVSHSHSAAHHRTALTASNACVLFAGFLKFTLILSYSILSYFMKYILYSTGSSVRPIHLLCWLQHLSAALHLRAVCRHRSVLPCPRAVSVRGDTVGAVLHVLRCYS